jgi:hypothetical protein
MHDDSYKQLLISKLSLTYSGRELHYNLCLPSSLKPFIIDITYRRCSIVGYTIIGRYE